MYVQQLARIPSAKVAVIAADERARVLVALVSLSLVLVLILRIGAELLRGT